MELFANELSIERQFWEVALFQSALSRLLSLREVAREFDREVRCHRGFAQIEPIGGMPFRRAIQGMDLDRVRTVMQWLDHSGPFWDEERHHGEDDWVESSDQLVTGTAVGEAAYRVWEGEACGLVSARPGSWDFSPVSVTLRPDGARDDEQLEIENWREPETLRRRFESLQPPVGSWAAVEASARRRYSALCVADQCFAPLRGVPFNRSAAERVLYLLRVLDRFAGAFDRDGERSVEGHRIYQQYFTGGTGRAERRASFSDSTDSEKREFRTKLTFPHPDAPGRTLFCPWHGKEHHLLLRLHFSWPIQAGKPVYVVYVGRKLTAR